MKRRLFQLAIFILLGAVVNVVVAWGCARWSDVRFYSEQLPKSDAIAVWERYAPQGWALTGTQEVSTASEFGITSLLVLQDALASDVEKNIELDQGGRVQYYVAEIRAGWPFRCLRAGLWQRIGIAPIARNGLLVRTSHTYEILTGWPHSNTDPGLRQITAGRIIPLGPMMSGMLINTLIYSGLLWVVGRAPGAVRRHIRLQRCRCPVSGYDLRGDLERGCPECGWQR